MSLAAGTRLGPYEIQSAIGAGGMGEVYKARDTRLDRTVAIKVLRPDVAADHDRRIRFAREAKTIAGLNHPRICTLFDVGESGGTTYLVMEHVAGETLAARLRKGPLTVDQALGIAADMADALAAAHGSGVIHRDLKPGNVMLTKAGAKLLDFGLAKLQPQGAMLSSVTRSAMPTQEPATSAGTFLGTVPYMSPEQLEGKDTDARSDIFSFGGVLYEMLTGRHAFEGSSQASVIAAIMERDPPLVSSIQPLTPPALDRLVRKCLAKDPDERWQTARDLADELRWVLRAVPKLAGKQPPPEAPRTSRSAALAWWVAVAAILVAAVSTVLALAWRRPSTKPGPPEVVRFLLSERLPAALESDPVRLFAVSRDGRRVVFVAEKDGVSCLYLRELQTPEARIIPGTENAMQPFFSPDGQRVGFFAGRRLKVVSLAGGNPEDRAQTRWPRGATWAPDGTIIFCPSDSSGLWQLPAAGGAPRLLAKPDPAKGERSYRWPEVLPGGDAVLFTLSTSDTRSFDEARVMIRSLRTGEQHEVIRGGSFAMGTPTGHLLFARAGALMAAPFDLTRGVVTGTPTPVVPGLVTYPMTGAAQYAVSDNGMLIYTAGQAVSRETRLVWIDREGRTVPLGTPAGTYQAVSISPDGGWAALDIDGANASIWLLDLKRTSPTRLTHQWSNNGPFWTTDGSRVCFSSERGGVSQFYCQAAESATPPAPLTPPGASGLSFPSWSPDGRFLAFGEWSQQSGWDIWLRGFDVNQTLTPFLQTPFNEMNPRFSPDGRWLAYQSDDSGPNEVYVRPFPGPGRPWRISTGGGEQPLWARSGRELFYRSGEAIMAAAIDTAPTFSPRSPRELFRQALRVGGQYAYDVAPDGRFLALNALSPPRLGPVTVVLNWWEELKQKSPAR